MTHYVLIGTGIAAMAAAESIRSLDANGEITLLGNDPHGFYSRPGLAYYLTGEIPEQQLFPYPPQALKALQLRFRRTTVTHINPAEHSLQCEDGSLLKYDRLLLATGARAMPLHVPGAPHNSVVKLDHLDDARRILALARRSKRAVVVGGGITALEIVEGLAAQRVQVHYLLRGERYWGNVLDETESRIVEDRLRAEGVHLHFNTELSEIVSKNGKISGVRTRDGRDIRCDMVAYAIGVQPRIELAQRAGIACERGILTDDTLRTNQPDIFAAGDCAQVYDPAAGRAILDSLWAPARAQGCTAGLNMAGKTIPYQKATPFNVTRLAGLTTTIIGAVGNGRDTDITGIARGDSETWRTIPDAIIAQTGFEVNRLRLMIGQKHILGAVIIGDQTLSAPLQTLIQQKADISSIRGALLKPSAPIADMIAHYWSTWRLHHAA